VSECVFDRSSLAEGDGWSAGPPSPPAPATEPEPGCECCVRLLKEASANHDKLYALRSQVTALETQVVATVDRARGLENTLRTAELRQQGAVRKWEDSEEKKEEAEFQMRSAQRALALVEEELVKERERRIAAEVALEAAEEAVERLTTEQARARGRDTGRAAVEVLLQGGAATVVRGLQQQVSQLERQRDSLEARATRCSEAEALAETLSRRLAVAESRPPPPPTPSKPAPRAPLARPWSGGC